MRAIAAIAVAGGLAAAAGGFAACGSFENEEIVIDLRVLAMVSSEPEQVVDVDLSNPPRPEDLLAQLVPAEMCALVADPARDRRIRWSMTLCALEGDQRCSSAARLVLASGIAEDPETARPAPRMCGTVVPDGNLLGILLEASDGDVLAALGGIEYGVSLVVAGEEDPPALEVSAGKRMRVSPRIPMGRTANKNPTLARLEGVIDGGEPVALAPGRCADQTAPPLELLPSQTVRLTPIEPDGAREVYVVPRLDGETQTFTESLTYQWLASAGGFSSGSTGGPHDIAGNPAPLFTDYKAPAAKDLTGPTDVQLWVIQRDERFGAAWYEACVRVVP